MQSFRLDEDTRFKLHEITSYLFTRGMISKNKYTQALEYLINNFDLDGTDEEA